MELILDKGLESELVLEAIDIGSYIEQNEDFIATVLNSVVAKLLRCEFNFSRLIYLSEMLLNKYKYIQSQVNDMESYKLSKLYIDKILNQSDKIQD